VAGPGRWRGLLGPPMPPLTLLIPRSLNGEPGLFAALSGVSGSRSWQEWLGGPGGLSAQHYSPKSRYDVACFQQAQHNPR